MKKLILIFILVIFFINIISVSASCIFYCSKEEYAAIKSQEAKELREGLNKRIKGRNRETITYIYDRKVRDFNRQIAEEAKHERDIAIRKAARFLDKSETSNSLSAKTNQFFMSDSDKMSRMVAAARTDTALRGAKKGVEAAFARRGLKPPQGVVNKIAKISFDDNAGVLDAGVVITYQLTKRGGEALFFAGGATVKGVQTVGSWVGSEAISTTIGAIEKGITAGGPLENKVAVAGKFYAGHIADAAVGGYFGGKILHKAHGVFHKGEKLTHGTLKEVAKRMGKEGKRSKAIAKGLEETLHQALHRGGEVLSMNVHTTAAVAGGVSVIIKKLGGAQSSKDYRSSFNKPDWICYGDDCICQSTGCKDEKGNQYNEGVKISKKDDKPVDRPIIPFTYEKTDKPKKVASESALASKGGFTPNDEFCQTAWDAECEKKYGKQPLQPEPAVVIANGWQCIGSNCQCTSTCVDNNGKVYKAPAQKNDKKFNPKSVKLAKGENGELCVQKT